MNKKMTQKSNACHEKLDKGEKKGEMEGSGKEGRMAEKGKEERA